VNKLSNIEINAESLLNLALENYSISPWEWYEEYFFGGKEKNNEIEKIILDMQKNLAMIEEWGITVPSNRISTLLDISLGNNLLRSSSIRSLLIKYKIENANKEEFKQFLDIFDLSDLHKSSDIIQAAEEMQWKPSTRLAYEIVDLLGLPKIYAKAGTTDDREEFEIITPITSLKQLLDFQNKVKTDIIKTLTDKSKGLIVMPTGSGKTRTTIEAVIEYFKINNQPIEGIVWLADRDELCEQAYQSFKEILFHRSNHPVKISRYWSGNDMTISTTKKSTLNAGVIVTSMQQVDRRFKSGDPILMHLLKTCNLVIMDEAHRNINSNNSLIKFMKRNGNNPGILGITATPRRRDRIETGELFQIFDNNPIVPLEGNSSNVDDISSVLTKKGILANKITLNVQDLGLDDSNIHYNSILKTSFDIVNCLLEKGAKSIIVFAEDVQHSKQLSGALRLNKISSSHLDSSTPNMQRRQIIHDFKNNKISVLVNYGILTTGFDAPNVDAVAIFRKTDNIDQPIITQMIGRGLRGPKFGGTESCMIYLRGET
jgi:DNA repair protein RadD